MGAGCDTNSLLAIKINIVLIFKRYNIIVILLYQNSFRVLPIKVTFHFKVSSLATLQFKESRKKTKRENI